MRERVKHLVKYASASSLISLLEIVLLAVFVELLGLYYLFGAIGGFLCANLIHYILVRLFVYKESAVPHGSGYPKFLLTLSSSTLGNLALFYILVEYLSVYYLLARPISLGAVGIVSYLINTFIIFPSTKEDFDHTKEKGAA